MRANSISLAPNRMSFSRIVLSSCSTEELLRAAFADWKIEELVEYEDHIAEGMGHKGRSALIGLIAQKP